MRKAYQSGSHRSIDPEATLERVRPLMPAMGITRIANVTGLDVLGIPVVVVARPNARNLAVSQGKGPTLAAAQASGLMESVELFHAERIARPLRLATYQDLVTGHAVVDPARLPRIATQPFDPTMRLLWIAGRRLDGTGEVWVPYELVHMDYRLPLPEGSGCFLMSSNGLASGNHPLEALCHGLCELIERDADAVWKAGGPAVQARTRLDLESVDDPLCRELLDRYEERRIVVAVWETTSDLGVPAYRSTIMDAKASDQRFAGANSGMGCHPAREVALARALLEAAQSRLTMIAGSRDDVSRIDYDLARNPDSLARLREALRSEPPARRFHDAPTFASATFDEDLSWLLERIALAGLEPPIAVDLTLEELDVPVVRVLLPGLESTTLATGYLPGERARRASAGASG